MKKLVLVFIVFLLCFTLVSADEDIVVNMPEKVSSMQPFPLEIGVSPNQRNNITSISFHSVENGCENLILDPIDKLENSRTINYSGESYMKFTATAYFDPSFRYELPAICTYRFNFQTKGDHHRIEKKLTINPAKLSIDVPDYDWLDYLSRTRNTQDYRGTVEWDYEDDDVSCGTINEDTLGILFYRLDIKSGRAYSSGIRFELNREGTSFKEYVESKTKSVAEKLDGKVWTEKYPGSVEEIALPGYDVAYKRSVDYIDIREHSMEGYPDSYCFDRYYKIYGITEDGILVMLTNSVHGRYDSREQVEDIFAQVEKDSITALSTFRLTETDYEFTPLYDSYKEIEDEKEVEEEQEEEEQKDIAEKEFKISFSGKDNKEIWNRGRLNTKDADTFEILVKVKGKAYDKDGDKIKVSDEELFSGVKLVSEIDMGKDNDSQIGITGSLEKKMLRSVENKLETIDIRGKGPHLYKSFYKPEEKVYVHLEYKGEIVSNKLEYLVNIKDASPTIKLRRPTLEVQDGAMRGIHFDVEDADKSDLTCSLMVPTDFAIKGGVPFPSLEHEGQMTTLVKIPCKDGDTIKVMYHAPNFGNFNLNNELNALSMWKMQQNTMKTLATDLIGFGVEVRLGKLKKGAKKFNKVYESTGNAENLKNAQNFQNAYDDLSKANDIAGDVQKVVNIDQLKGNVENAGKTPAGTGKQGWLEWGADWGVYGIDLAQSTVGSIAMAPGKLPVVGPLGKKMGSAFSTTFNLMTNVWKGNLEYLSKVEKINRAKEMRFPYPVIITVDDKDGFVTKDIQNVMVVYDWLE